MSTTLLSILKACDTQGMKATHLSLIEAKEIFLEIGYEGGDEFSAFLAELKKESGVELILHDDVYSLLFDFETGEPKFIDSEEKEIPSSTEPVKKTFAQTATQVADRAKILQSELMKNYSALVTDGKMPEKRINALAQVLARCPLKQWESERKSLFNNSPDVLYLWGVANSNIAFPFLSLKDAEERVKQSVPMAPEWGYNGNGIWHLPKKESCDSNWWMFIHFILESLLPEDHKIEYIDFNDSMPSLANAEVEKRNDIAVILHRIVELHKNPCSATLRTGDDEKITNLRTKNILDMDLVEKFRQTDKCTWKNMSYSAKAILYLRRSKQIPDTVMVKGKPVASNRNILLGSKLAQICKTYCPKESKLELESEPFYRLISSLLDVLVREIPNTWEPSKKIFLSASDYIKSDIRKGPKIKTKDGKERTNAYIPFSFVKSAECELFPSSTKQELTSLGSYINNELDKINNLSLIQASEMIPYYKKALQIAYNVSDEVRKHWRSTASIPRRIEFIENLFSEEIFPALQDKNLGLKSVGSVLSKVFKEIDKISYKKFSDNEEEIQAVKARISKSNEERRKKRVTSA